MIRFLDIPSSWVRHKAFSSCCGTERSPEEHIFLNLCSPRINHLTYQASSFRLTFSSHSTVVFRVSTIWQEILPIFLPQYYETVLWQENYYISYCASLDEKLLIKGSAANGNFFFPNVCNFLTYQALKHSKFVKNMKRIAFTLKTIWIRSWI